MRYLLTMIITNIILVISFLVVEDKSGLFKENYDYSDTISGNNDSISGFKDAQQSNAKILQRDERDWKHYYGDTLVQYGNTAVCISYGCETGTKEVASIDQTMCITVRDSVPVDTCLIVDMHDGVFAKHETIYAMLGIDTLCFDAMNLPKEINMMDIYMAGKGWREYRYSNTYSLSDASFNCDFYFQTYLPKNVPVWTKKIIKTIISHDILSMYHVDNRAGRILKEYYGITASPKQLRYINYSKAPPEQIAVHYAKEFERLYRKEFDETDEEGRRRGPKYDYLFKMNPAWKSSDGKYVTYRFYTFNYTMGMHGLMNEFYLTFDNTTGRILGAEELFKTDKYNSVITILENKINDYKHEYMSEDIHFAANLNSETYEINSSTLTKEIVEGKLYPRPAMTEKGVVFTYQPYEMGSFVEGVIHFLIPYNEIQQFLTIKR